MKEMQLSDIHMGHLLCLEGGSDELLLAHHYRGDRVEEHRFSKPTSWMQALSSLEGLSTVPWSALLLGHGPGSYTGLRLAMATAGGLALGWDIPLLLVTTLAAWIEREETALVLLDAKAGGVYAQWFVDGLAYAPARRLSHGDSPIAEGFSPSIESRYTVISPQAETLQHFFDWSAVWRTRRSHSYGLLRQLDNNSNYCKIEPPFSGIEINYLKSSYFSNRIDP